MSSGEKSPLLGAGEKEPSQSCCLMCFSGPTAEELNVFKVGCGWVDDEYRAVCFHCEKPFHWFKRRKHHCRLCGEVFCEDCWGPLAMLPAPIFRVAMHSLSSAASSPLNNVSPPAPPKRKLREPPPAAPINLASVLRGADENNVDDDDTEAPANPNEEPPIVETPTVDSDDDVFTPAVETIQMSSLPPQPQEGVPASHNNLSQQLTKILSKAQPVCRASCLLWTTDPMRQCLVYHEITFGEDYDVLRQDDSGMEEVVTAREVQKAPCVLVALRRIGQKTAEQGLQWYDIPSNEEHRFVVHLRRWRPFSKQTQFVFSEVHGMKNILEEQNTEGIYPQARKATKTSSSLSSRGVSHTLRTSSSPRTGSPQVNAQPSALKNKSGGGRKVPFLVTAVAPASPAADGERRQPPTDEEVNRSAALSLTSTWSVGCDSVSPSQTVKWDDGRFQLLQLETFSEVLQMQVLKCGSVDPSEVANVAGHSKARSGQKNPFSAGSTDQPITAPTVALQKLFNDAISLARVRSRVRLSTTKVPSAKMLKKK